MFNSVDATTVRAKYQTNNIYKTHLYIMCIEMCTMCIFLDCVCATLNCFDDALMLRVRKQEVREEGQ